jgi:hypothetical protein
MGFCGLYSVGSGKANWGNGVTTLSIISENQTYEADRNFKIRKTLTATRTLEPSVIANTEY